MKRKVKLAFEELERELAVIPRMKLSNIVGGSGDNGGYWAYINGKWEYTYNGGTIEEVVVTGSGSSGSNSNWYGNYLGPNNVDGGLPIDYLDFAAFMHDKGYDKVGAVGIKSALMNYDTLEADALLALMAIDVVTSTGDESLKARAWGVLTSAAFGTIAISKAPAAAYDAFWKYVADNIGSTGH